MPAPNMRDYVLGLRGQTLRTVARGRPNTVVAVTEHRVLVETHDGAQNYAPLRPLQELAERIYAGEEVVVPIHERSAFNLAVLATLPEIEIGLRPRRAWLRDAPEAFDAEYAELF